METGIVILNYNDFITTKKLIDNIKDYSSIDHILVVDNSSNDNSFNELKKIKLKNYEVIKTKENKGYAYGNNYGIKYLIKNYDIKNIIISNPDVIFKDDTIKKLKKDLEKEDITLIAPVVVEHGALSKGWKLPRYTDDLLSNVLYFHKYFKKRLEYKDDYYQDKKLVKVDAVHGCFFMIKAKDFLDIGLFDENTFLYYEENIIGKKLKQKGYSSYVDTKINVIHNLSISVDKSINSIKKYKILKNSQKYYEKNYNNINFIQLIILRLFYYISLFLANIKVFICSRRNK